MTKLTKAQRELLSALSTAKQGALTPKELQGKTKLTLRGMIRVMRRMRRIGLVDHEMVNGFYHLTITSFGRSLLETG
jgi:hypothetical protein